MISWIQLTFQKHFRAMFAVLLGVIIISFVFTIGAAPGIGRAGHKVLEQPFFGYNLGSEDQARRIFRDGQFSAQLKGAYQAQAGQIQEYSLSRIAGLALADQLGLPQPTDKEISAFVAQLPAFQNDKSEFDSQRYQQFADSLKGSRDFTAADVNRIFRDDARLEALNKVVAGPGYVMPSEIAEQLERADTSWSLDIATLDYAKFSPTINVTDDVLQKFFDDNSFRYEIPARPRVSIVEFKSSDFAPANAPTEAEARSYYNANQSRFPAPIEAGKDAAANSTDAFAKVRPQVETAMKEEAARRRASRAANDFTVALYERKITANSAELSQYLSSQNRSAVAVAPFSPDSPPADRAWLGNHAEQILRLNAQRFFSDPLASPDGYVVLLWNESLPARKPVLAEVRDKVANDYRESEKRKRFSEEGKALREKLQAAVKSGQTFEAAAAAQKLEVKNYSNFTMRQPPQDLPYAAFSAMQTLEVGQISDMIAASDKGHFVHAAAKKAPDASTANPRYAEIRKQLMQYTAATTQTALLGSLVEAELRKSAPPKTATP